MPNLNSTISWGNFLLTVIDPATKWIRKEQWRSINKIITYFFHFKQEAEQSKVNTHQVHYPGLVEDFSMHFRKEQKNWACYLRNQLQQAEAPYCTLPRSKLIGFNGLDNQRYRTSLYLNMVHRIEPPVAPTARFDRRCTEIDQPY